MNLTTIDHGRFPERYQEALVPTSRRGRRPRSHTPTGRLRTARGWEGELANRARGGENRSADTGGEGGVHRLLGAEVKKRKKTRKAEKERRRGDPLHRGEVTSRQQALPRRGWVAPRRPRINKTTARPSPVLGSCLASACRMLARRSDARRPDGGARVLRARTNPRIRRDLPRAARKPARVRNSRRGSIFDGGGDAGQECPRENPREVHTIRGIRFRLCGEIQERT